MLRALGVLAASTSIAWAQFGGLATPYDGSKVYFSSTLRLKGTSQPNYGKLFVADESGVRLFHVLPKVDVQPSGNLCVVGSQYSILSTQVSADASVVAGYGEETFAGACSGYLSSTDLITPAGERQVEGPLRLSPGGRYAAVDTTSTISLDHTFAVLDLKTGASTPIPLPPETCHFGLPAKSIADNGTVILNCSLSGAGGFSLGYIAKLGEAAQPFPVSGGIPFALSADGAKVLYSKGQRNTFEAHILDLNTQQDQFVPVANFSVVAMSDDANRILLWSDRPYMIGSDGAGLKPLTPSPLVIAQPVVLSGDGKVVYIATAGGELIKINTETGEITQVIGRTPYVSSVSQGTAGFVTTVSVNNLADTTMQASPPLPNSLGNVSVHIDLPGRLGDGKGVSVGRIDLPVDGVSGGNYGYLRFQLPWDFQPLRIDLRRPIPITVEAPGVNTPFDFPEVLMYVQAGSGATLVLPNGLPHRGEQFEVRAAGLGRVYPEVPLGFAASSVEPLSRLVQPLTCIVEHPTPQTIPILYAGLLPGYVDRIYQVILRAPADVAGIYLIRCSLGGGPYLDWVQVQVLP